MKILIISDAWHPQVNGVVRTYEYLGEELIKMGHTVKVIGPSDFPYKIPMPGYAEIKLALKPYRRLSAMIQDFHPDHLHIATEGPLGIAARRYALRQRIPFSTSYHTHFPEYLAQRIKKIMPPLAPVMRRLSIWRLRRFHAPAQSIMLATESLARELTDWNFKTPQKPLTRGVDLDLFKPAPSSLFQSLPRPIALYVGRVAIEKNIEAFLDMPWQGSKVVVGHGPALDELKAHYPDVVFAGKQIGPALAAHYQSADVFVFPSKTDTFGIVLIEALACGLPVAAYPVTGPRDIITVPYLGALDENLAAAAEKALACGSPDERHAHIRENYSWERAARQFLEAS